MKLRITERTRPGYPDRRHLRRGVAYLLAISVGTVLAVIGFAVITSARIAGRATSRANHAAEARVLAMSAAEKALSLLDLTPAWRTSMLNGVESTPVSLGGGTVSYMLVDEGDPRP